MMKAGGGEKGEKGKLRYLPCIRDLGMTYKVTPLFPTPRQSWQVCRGRKRAHRTKAVPRPAFLHNTPNSGNLPAPELQRDCARMRSYSRLA